MKYVALHQAIRFSTVRIVNRKIINRIDTSTSRRTMSRTINKIFQFKTPIGTSFIIVLVTTTIICLQVFSGQSDLYGVGTQNDIKTQLSDGGSISVKLEPSPNLIKAHTPTQLKVSFLNPSTGQIQPHIDYDLIITDNSTGKNVFQASNLTGQSGIPLHTAESIVTIPFTFEKAGAYTAKVNISGILFTPIIPESANFPIKVR
jgi:hypothetical protein